MGYTNHTLLPEALEKWPVALLERVVPRHLQIIYEINRRFLEHVASVWPGDHERLQRMSLIEEGASKQVRMAHLASSAAIRSTASPRCTAGSCRRRWLRISIALWPERFNNKTNGVTPRRWLVQANPLLARLITRTIGDGWITDLDRLRELEPCASDGAFREEFMAIKRSNKERLARVIAETTGVDRRPGFAVRRPGQAHPRIQAAAAQRHAHRARVPVPDRRRHAAGRAQNLRLRGEGGAGLLGRQADHQD